MCAIRDSAMDAFQRPFCVPAVGMAVRSFGDACLSKEGGMNGHLGDYALFEVGTFDEESGKCENLSSPRQLARGIDYKEISDV
jgi:hypothetical protein